MLVLDGNIQAVKFILQLKEEQIEIYALRGSQMSKLC